MTLSTFKADLWEWSTSFDQLSRIMSDISDSHEIPVIVNTVYNDIHIDT